MPRHGQSAVDRNRLKRRLREIIRQDVLPSNRGLDIIVRAAPGAYTVAFADLEQFQVDYQEKNLKVKVRRGKQYNFTDPDGNADRLFVFQRDVDKVRQRLAKGEAAPN